MRPTLLLPRIPVHIRLAQEEDVEQLLWSGGDKELHRERWKRQLRGEALYFLALVNDYPIGHAFLKWSGKPTAPHYPNVEDVQVMEPFRGFGVGTALLDACERACQERGLSRIGLAVGVENARARALYERLGYRVLSRPPYRWGAEYVIDMEKSLIPREEESHAPS